VARVAARPEALTGGPFLGSAAVTSGLLTPAQLRSAAWRRLFRGVYADARLPFDHRLAVRGASLLLQPGAAITGRSAAHLYGAQLCGATDPVEVATAGKWRGPAGIHVASRRHRAEELRVYAGVLMTTPLATAHGLARDLPLEEAVVWLDALGRARNLTRAGLCAYTQSQPHRPGWQRAKRAVELCDPRAESPPESRVRLWVTLAGLPPPVPQFHVHDPDGHFVARVDLAWPALKIALEYDGQWHADPHQLTRDRRRLRALNALGWYVYPVTNADLHTPPPSSRRSARYYLADVPGGDRSFRCYSALDNSNNCGGTDSAGGWRAPVRGRYR
jgi:hypothetical protein